MTLSAAIGFIMVLVLVFCLIKKKMLPSVAFIVLPVIAVFLAGYNIYFFKRHSWTRGMDT